jgi:hypothetical protein
MRIAALTPSSIKSFIGLVALVLVWPLTLAAQGRRMALVVGNEEYLASPKLPNAVHDAEDLAATLTGLGFEVTLMRNVATASDLDMAARRFTNELRRDDLALFYFAGHGAQISRDQTNYLMPTRFSGTTMADLRRDGFPASRIVELLDDSNASIKLVFFDACRNNPFTRSVRNSANTYQTLVPHASTQRGTLITYAAKETQVAIDVGPNKRNGLFTYHLMREIKKPGVDLLDSLRSVADAVDQDSQESQTPVFSGRYSGRYFLMEGPKPNSIETPDLPLPKPPAPAGSQLEQYVEALKGSWVSESSVDAWDEPATRVDARANVVSCRIKQKQTVRLKIEASVSQYGGYIGTKSIRATEETSFVGISSGPSACKFELTGSHEAQYIITERIGFIWIDGRLTTQTAGNATCQLMCSTKEMQQELTLMGAASEPSTNRFELRGQELVKISSKGKELMRFRRP